MAYKIKWYDTELEKIARKQIAINLRKAAQIVKTKARALAPVSQEPHVFRGKTYEPGALRKSIAYRVESSNLRALIGTSLVYGIFQELWPVTGKVDYYRAGKRITANKQWKFTPFLRPALHASESEIAEIVGRDILESGAKKIQLKPADILL